MIVRPQPELMPGAPQYVVWALGFVFIVLALGLIYSVIAIAIGIYHEAQSRRTWPVVWLVAALLGGWLTAIIWLVVRDRFADLALEDIMDQAAGTRGEAPAEAPPPQSDGSPRAG